MVKNLHLDRQQNTLAQSTRVGYAAIGGERRRPVECAGLRNVLFFRLYI